MKLNQASTQRPIMLDNMGSTASGRCCYYQMCHSLHQKINNNARLPSTPIGQQITVEGFNNTTKVENNKQLRKRHQKMHYGSHYDDNDDTYHIRPSTQRS